MKGALELDPVAIGKRIRAAREAAGLSQRQAVAGLSFSAPYVSRLESGDRVPSLGVLHDLAERLDTTARKLAFGDAPGPCPFCGRIGF